MKGEGYCKVAAEKDGAEGSSHCIHLLVRRREYVCCWCGDLFHADEPDEHPNHWHGQYRPRRRHRRG